MLISMSSLTHTKAVGKPLPQPANSGRMGEAPYRRGEGIAHPDEHMLIWMVRRQGLVDCLSGLFHDGKCRFSERQLRQIRSLPTEKQQIRAFEELRRRVDTQAGRGHQSVGN
jgi:hypothetical protein